MTLYDYLIEVKGYNPTDAQEVVEAYTSDEELDTAIMTDIADYIEAEEHL